MLKNITISILFLIIVTASYGASIRDALNNNTAKGTGVPMERSGNIMTIKKDANIAVAEFSGKNVSQADASIVADFLRTELVSTGHCNVVDKTNMDKLLAESAFQQTGCTSTECAVQIGKILNVSFMVTGSLAKLMDTFYVTASLVDIETGKITASYDQDAATAKELKTGCKNLAYKLTGFETQDSSQLKSKKIKPAEKF